MGPDRDGGVVFARCLAEDGGVTQGLGKGARILTH